jgi:hypothetical protein
MEKRRTIFATAVIIFFMYILYYFIGTDHLAGAIAYILTVSFFYIADKIFALDFKKHHYIILIFMATAGILFSPVYFILPTYDKVLHFFFPFLGSFLIFYLVNKKFKMDFRTKVIFTFTIMITLISFEEMIEYLLDVFLDMKLQGVYAGNRVLFESAPADQLIVIYHRITDTMLDLILGTIGSFLFMVMKIITGDKKVKKIKPQKK